MDDKLMTNPYYARAIEYIRTHDLNSLDSGRHVIDGDNLFVNIVDASLRKPMEARLEAHDRYIDIQVPLSRSESYGVKPRSKCTSPIGEIDVNDDILFFEDVIETVISAEAGDVVTFAPDMAHAPLIGEGNIHKAIFKVKVV